MAVVTQSPSTTTKAVQEARQIALPILAMGVIVAILLVAIYLPMFSMLGQSKF